MNNRLFRSCRVFPLKRVVLWTGALLFLMGPMGLNGLLGQMTTGMDPDAQVTHEAEGVKNILNTVLKDYVLASRPLSQMDIAQIEEQLKTSQRYAGRFDPESRGEYNLLQAYLAFYQGDLKAAFRQGRQALIVDPENKNISDSMIYMALISQDYDTAKQQLKSRDAGLEAIQNIILTWKGQRAESEKKTRSDPKASKKDMFQLQMAMGGRSKTSKLPSTETEPGQGEKNSKWDIERPEPEKNPVLTGLDPMEQKASVVKLEGPVPIEADYLKLIEKQGALQTTAPARSSGRRHRSRGSSEQTALELPVDYMPFLDLGEGFHDLQLRNLNGTWFHYQAGKGQVLCALLWSSPGDEKQSRRTSRRRQSPRQDEEVDLPTEAPILEAEDSLSANVDQFREYFNWFYLQGKEHNSEGKIFFVSINFDPDHEESRQSVAELITEEPWPWANCRYADSLNQDQFESISASSPVMMIVGASGTIRYIGPVGGVVPRTILKQELQMAVADTETAPMSLPATAQPGQAANQPSSSLLGLLWSGKPSGTTEEPSQQTNAEETDSAADRQPENETADSSEQNPEEKTAGTEDEPTTLAGYHKANQIIQTANVQFRTRVYHRALDLCDTILEEWPERPEADEAREMILKILEKIPAYKVERQQQGKWVGP